MYDQWCSSQSEVVLHCHEQTSLLSLFHPETANLVASQIVFCVRVQCSCHNSFKKISLPTSNASDTGSTQNLYRQMAWGVPNASSVDNLDIMNSREFNTKIDIEAPCCITGAYSPIMVIMGPLTVQVEREDQVAWLMQVINYALTMPLQYIQVIQHAVHIYCNWLQALLPIMNDQQASNDVKTIPRAVLHDPNRYAQAILYSLVNIFVKRRLFTKVPIPSSSDKKDDLSRKDSSMPILQSIISGVLSLVEKLAKESNSLTPETWQCLLHFCLASCHHMLSPVNDTNDLGEILSDQLMKVLFTVWLHASEVCFPKPGLWRAFTELSQTWRHRVNVFRVWYNVCAQLTAKVLQMMYSDSSITYPIELLTDVRKDGVKVILPPNMDKKTIQECWIRMIHLLGNPSDVGHLLSIYENRMKILTGTSDGISPDHLPILFNADYFWSRSPPNNTPMARGQVGMLASISRDVYASPSNTNLSTTLCPTLKPERLAFIFYCGVSYVSLLCDAFLGFSRSQNIYSGAGATPFSISGNVVTVNKPIPPVNVTAHTKVGKPAKFQGSGGSPPEMRRSEAVAGRLMQAAGKVSNVITEKSRKKSSMAAYLSSGSEWQQQQPSNVMAPGSYSVDFPQNTQTMYGPADTDGVSGETSHPLQFYPSSGPPTISNTGSLQISARVGFGGSRENLLLFRGETSRSLRAICSGLHLADVSRPHRLRPEASCLLNLFGSWLFEAAVCGVKVDMNNAPIRLRSSSLEHLDFQFGRAEACGVLCRIFCTSSESGVLKVYLTRFYAMIYYGLAIVENQFDPYVLATILYNSMNLLRVDLEGVHILIPRLLGAIRKVLDHDLKSIVTHDFLSPILLRRAALHQLLSLLCVSCQFRGLSIKSLVPVEDKVDDILDFSNVRSVVWSLLLNILSKEKDPINLQMSLGASLAMVEDYFCEEALCPKFKPYGHEKPCSPMSLFNLLVTLIAGHIRQTWTSDLSTTFYALEALCGLVQMKSDITDLTALRRCVRCLCEFINIQIHRDPKDHSRFLHSIMVAAYHCLNTCVVYHSHILDDPTCLECLLNTIELGLTGTATVTNAGSESINANVSQFTPVSQSSVHKRQGSSGGTNTSGSGHSHHHQHQSSFPMQQQSWNEALSAATGGITSSGIMNGSFTTSTDGSQSVQRLHHRSAKRQQPASKRVQHAAENLLACLMEQAGAHPTPAGPMVSQSSLMDEMAIFQHIKKDGTAIAANSFRYFWLDPGLLVALLEVNTTNATSDAADAASVFVLIRGPHGRQSWYLNPRRLPQPDSVLNVIPSRPEPTSRYTHIVNRCMEHPRRQQSMDLSDTQSDEEAHEQCSAIGIMHVDPQRLIYRKHPMENCMPPLEDTNKESKLYKEETWLKKLISDQTHVLNERNDLLKRAREKVTYPNPALDFKPFERKRELQTARLLLCHLGYLRVNMHFFLTIQSPYVEAYNPQLNANIDISGRKILQSRISGGITQSGVRKTSWEDAASVGIESSHLEGLNIDPTYSSQHGLGYADGPSSGPHYKYPVGEPNNSSVTDFYAHFGDDEAVQGGYESGGSATAKNTFPSGYPQSTPSSMSYQHPPNICALDSSAKQFYDSLRQLDAMTTRYVETMHCFFVAPGQRDASQIVANLNANNLDNLPKAFIDFLHSLGYPVRVKSHLGWGGLDTYLGDLLSRETDNTVPVGCWDGCDDLLYWSDFSWELAILCPSAKTWRNPSPPKPLKSPKNTKLVENTIPEISHPQESMNAQLQRQSLYLPTLMRLDQLDSIPSNRTQSVSVDPRSGSRTTPSTSLGDASTSTSSPTRIDVLPVSSHVRIALFWLESRDDLDECPEMTLLNGCVDLLHSPLAAASGSNVTAAVDSQHYLFIYILPLRSGLYRVELHKSVGKTYDAGPLAPGMVLSSRCLASLVRQTVQNVTRRRRLELDSLIPPHVRRARKIDEIRLHHCTHENSLPHLLVGLFHYPVGFTEPRF